MLDTATGPSVEENTNLHRVSGAGEGDPINTMSMCGSAGLGAGPRWDLQDGVDHAGDHGADHVPQGVRRGAGRMGLPAKVESGR